MKIQKSKKEKGFTLVELSIVLVIIGLLIGGLLVGQSMIKTTKIQSQVRQIQQFDIAVENFKSQYGGFPGDTSVYESDGDDDGTIEDTSGGIAEMNDEIGAFWNNLSTNGFGSATYTADSMTVGTGIPEANLGSSQGGFVAYGVSGTNYYQAAIFIDSGGNFNVDASLLPSDGLSLDTKMDDGVANTGNVVAREGSGTDSLNQTASAGAAGGATCLVTGGAVYNVTYNTDEQCALRFKMLSQTSE